MIVRVARMSEGKKVFMEYGNVKSINDLEDSIGIEVYNGGSYTYTKKELVKIDKLLELNRVGNEFI